jgi:hypothetical protein
MIIRLLRYGLLTTLVVAAIPCRAAPEEGANNAADKAVAQATTLACVAAPASH